MRPLPTFRRMDMETERVTDTELSKALEALKDTPNRVYYDEVKDKTDREEYYKEFQNEPGGKEISFAVPTADQRIIKITVAEEYLTSNSSGVTFNTLSALVRKTHKTSLPYKPSRYVYPWMDLHPDGKIHSIYSGEIFTAEDLIRLDFEISHERAARLRNIMSTQRDINNEMMETEFDNLERALPYNCEHVVPQSWFDKRQPMRGDLHHLFGCESKCNSFRSNVPYFDFTDYERAIRDSCGKREENKFEPESGKGAAARALLYFLLRYPGEINSTSREFEAERLPHVLRWHGENPVDEYERHRNQAAYELQGNRNPFIDYPQWVDSIDFTLGLGD